MSEHRKRLAAWGAILLAAALFGWCVWPTPYRYDHITTGSITLPVRMNRLTGRVEILRMRGWEPLAPKAKP